MKSYTIEEWCKLFGIRIIDNDGFRGMDLAKNVISFAEFFKGIVSCTIIPINDKKHKIFQYLVKIL